MPRTLILSPWFGPWPSWIGVLLLTCKYNPDIDWLLIGDHELPASVPGNVHFERTSFDEYLERCSASLGLSLAWHQPYKLCDLKPAYGIIHEPDIADYDIWGWTDLDVMYGDLSSFIRHRLHGHSVMSFSGTHLSGEFCLFKNHEAVNNAFRLIHDWRGLMSDKKNHALDEIALSWVFAPPQMDFVMFSRNRRTERGNIVAQDEADRLQKVHAACFENSYTTPTGIGLWHDGSNRHPIVWYWKAGMLSNKTHPLHSYPYLNLLNYKSDFYWRCALEAWGCSDDGLSPLWDDPVGRINDSLEELERCGFLIDRKGFSALHMELDDI